MSKPMRDRIPIHSVSDFNPRENRSAAQSILAMLGRGDNTLMESDARHFEASLRAGQMMICFVYIFIAIGLLQKPDLSVAIMTFLRFSTKLRAQGVIVPPREIERLVSIVKVVTIEYAVHIVFRTRTVWQDEKRPFQFRDMCVAPRLALTPQSRRPGLPVRHGGSRPAAAAHASRRLPSSCSRS